MAKIYGGRWKIIETLGGGGQSDVFRVLDTTGEFQGEYALKRVRNPYAMGTKLSAVTNDSGSALVVKSQFPERTGEAALLSDVQGRRKLDAGLAGGVLCHRKQPRLHLARLRRFRARLCKAEAADGRIVDRRRGRHGEQRDHLHKQFH